MTTAAEAAADRREEDASKRCAEETVDDEITRRVNDHQQVTELRVVEMKASTLSLVRLKERPEDLVEERWCLTDDEDADDHNDTQRDVVVLATSSMTVTLTFELRRDLPRRHWQRTSLYGVERGNQTNVEERQSAEWNDVHDRVVEHVTVDDLIQLTVAQYHRLIDVHVHCSCVDNGVDLLTGINHLQQHTYSERNPNSVAYSCA